jgi:hypothetical protein
MLWWGATTGFPSPAPLESSLLPLAVVFGSGSGEANPVGTQVHRADTRRDSEQASARRGFLDRRWKPAALALIACKKETR